jgi:alkylation response protein AidB-like acyl-CoA dehydrogenase
VSRWPGHLDGYRTRDIQDLRVPYADALGYTLDTPLASWYAEVRMQHLVDGPDEVHRWRIGRNVLAAHSGPRSAPGIHATRPSLHTV